MAIFASDIWDILCGLHSSVWCLQAPSNTIYYSNDLPSAETQFTTPTNLEEWLQCVHPDDMFAVKGKLYALLLGKNSHFDSEFRFATSNGQYGWLHCKGSKSTVSQDDIDEFFFVQNDVTEKMRVREELISSQNQARQVSLFLKEAIDAIPDPIFVKDEEHRWILINKAMMQLFGCKREEVLGKSDYDFFPREQAEIFRSIDQRVLDTEKSVENIENVTDQAGNMHVISTKKSIFRDSNGRKLLVGIARDITERMAFERRLKQSLYEIESQRQHIEGQAQQLKLQASDLRAARDKAQDASHAKSTFLANMSHEIRTPLNGVIGMSQLLSDTSLNAEQQEFVNTLNQSAHSLLFLINDILDFSKIEAGKFELVSEPFDLFSFLKSFERMVSPLVADKKLTFAVKKSANLPRFVVADKERLRQILLNLVTNAIKFTPETGTVTIVAENLPEPEQNKLSFAITDSGIGIAPEQQAEIFKAFEQADASVTRRFGGTGLGLAICKELVQLMGGALQLESQEGVGSTFSFAIRARKARPEELVEKLTEPETRKTETPLRILVAEDNMVNQRLITALLTREGHSVKTVNNGKEAIESFEQEDFDLVLMDIQMPVLGGEEAFAAIRKLPRGNRTPVIALTAHALTGDRNRFLSLGMNGFVSKPISRPKLMNTISEVTADKNSSGKSSQKVPYHIR